jgi:hypothetical protein
MADEFGGWGTACRVREGRGSPSQPATVDAKDRTDAAALDCTPRWHPLEIDRWAASLGSVSTGTSRHHPPIIGRPNARGEDSISLATRKPALRMIRRLRGATRGSPRAGPGSPVASPLLLVGADLYRGRRPREMLAR